MKYCLKNKMLIFYFIFSKTSTFNEKSKINTINGIYSKDCSLFSNENYLLQDREYNREIKNCNTVENDKLYIINYNNKNNSQQHLNYEANIDLHKYICYNNDSSNNPQQNLYYNTSNNSSFNNTQQNLHYNTSNNSSFNNTHQNLHYNTSNNSSFNNPQQNLYYNTSNNSSFNNTQQNLYYNTNINSFNKTHQNLYYNTNSNGNSNNNSSFNNSDQLANYCANNSNTLQELFKCSINYDTSQQTVCSDTLYQENHYSITDHILYPSVNFYNPEKYPDFAKQSTLNSGTVDSVQDRKVNYIYNNLSLQTKQINGNKGHIDDNGMFKKAQASNNAQQSNSNDNFESSNKSKLVTKINSKLANKNSPIKSIKFKNKKTIRKNNTTKDKWMCANKKIKDILNDMKTTNNLILNKEENKSTFNDDTTLNEFKNNSEIKRLEANTNHESINYEDSSVVSNTRKILKKTLLDYSLTTNSIDVNDELFLLIFELIENIVIHKNDIISTIQLMYSLRRFNNVNSDVSSKYEIFKHFIFLQLILQCFKKQDIAIEKNDFNYANTDFTNSNYLVNNALHSFFFLDCSSPKFKENLNVLLFNIENVSNRTIFVNGDILDNIKNLLSADIFQEYKQLNGKENKIKAFENVTRCIFNLSVYFEKSKLSHRFITNGPVVTALDCPSFNTDLGFITNFKALIYFQVIDSTFSFDQLFMLPKNNYFNFSDGQFINPLFSFIIDWIIFTIFHKDASSVCMKKYKRMYRFELSNEFKQILALTYLFIHQLVEINKNDDLSGKLTDQHANNNFTNCYQAITSEPKFNIVLNCSDKLRDILLANNVQFSNFLQIFKDHICKVMIHKYKKYIFYDIQRKFIMEFNDKNRRDLKKCLMKSLEILNYHINEAYKEAVKEISTVQ